MIYGFDIDGTICTTDCDYSEAKPYLEVIAKINALFEEGHTIIVFTSRGYKSGKDWYDFTKKQLDQWGVKYHMLFLGKPAGDVYIDDKAMRDIDFFSQMEKL